MIEIIAQTGTDMAIGAVGAVVGGGLIYWLAKRSINRLLNHMDNQAIHIGDGDKLVAEDVCKEKHNGMEKLLTEKFANQSNQIKGLHTEIKEVCRLIKDKN